MSVAANPVPAQLNAFVELNGTKKLDELNSLNIREAYSWDRDQIIEWLYKVADDPVLWGQGDQSIKPKLAELAGRISDLSLPKGNEYDAKGAWARLPSQHISRSYVQNWYGTELELGKPKFTVSGFVMPVDAGGVHLFNQYDMLGLFLGLLGPANANQANKYNLYLPLLAMYAQWCSELGTVAWPDGMFAMPTMFQCTWDVVSGRYRLGASLGGERAGRSDTGTWLEEIRNARFKVLTQSRQQRAAFKVVRGEEKHEKDRKDVDPPPWGNCAETYPFIDMFRDPMYNRNNLRGIALKCEFLLDEDAKRMASEAGTRKFYDDALRGRVFEFQEGPCANCRHLIWIGTGKNPNYPFFGKNLDQEKFPDLRNQRRIERLQREATEKAKADALKLQKEQQDAQGAEDAKNGWRKQ